MRVQNVELLALAHKSSIAFILVVSVAIIMLFFCESIDYTIVTFLFDHKQ